MEPGCGYASGYGKLCGTLGTFGVNGVYKLCLYAQISNDKVSAQENAKKPMVF